jgi:hypothetical protein
MRARAHSLVLPLVSVALGCQPAAPEERYVPAEVPTSAATISVEDVSGTILGRPFALQTARYIVDRRPHYEKIEIQLLTSKLDKVCDDTGANHDTTVWLRRKGPGEPKAETIRFGPEDPSSWQAHYEIYDDGKWSGSSNAAVMLDLAEPAPDLKLTGELYACFGDRTQSCVTGRFVAVYCPIRIDALVRGTDSMERPPPRSGRAAGHGPGSTPLAEAQEAPPGAPAKRSDVRP